MSLFAVYLRRPHGDDPRTDPFWEFNSFGRTGCHASNLLSPRCRIEPAVSSVVFLQGGEGCIRAVALADVSEIVRFTLAARDGKPQREGRELRWRSIIGPFVFESAPLLIDNRGNSDFKRIVAWLMKGSQRDTPVAGAASKLRARATALDGPMAIEVRDLFARWKGQSASAFHETIEEGAWRQRMTAREDAQRSERKKTYAALTGARVSRACR
jgi:hypothetical protein